MNSTDGLAGALDSRLFRDHFATEAMRKVFCDRAVLAAWFEVEAALARVEAAAGMIPREAADAIAEAATGTFDLDVIRQGMSAAKHPFTPALKELRKAAGEFGRFVHFGATTQDILDTAMVLQCRAGLDVICGDLETLLASLGVQIDRHRETVMAGRTHGQHATPTTLGAKLAVFAGELARHRDRLAQLRPRIEVVQLAGAAGTLASLGERAGEVRCALARELGLGEPLTVWHSARDNIAEAVWLLAATMTTCGRLAGEIADLQRSEIGELAEPSPATATGSSTMPQKQNPLTALGVVALANLGQGLPALALQANRHAHERDMSAWQMEWAIIPQAFNLADRAIVDTAAIIAGLEVDPGRMAANLATSGGLINAEAVMMALAAHVGHGEAHDIVEDIARRAASSGASFATLLKQDERVSAHLSDSDIDRLLKPENWLGEAVAMCGRVLGVIDGA